MKNLINWIEIPAADLERASAFYSKILGHELHATEMFGTKMAFFPTDGKNVSGAIVQGPDYNPSDRGVLAYLNGGDDLQKIADKIPSAGGTLLMEKTQISEEMGYFALFMDSEGNKMALHSIQ